MKYRFILILIFFLHQNSFGQTSILNDLSDTLLRKYINYAKQNYPKVRSYQNRINIANYNVSKTKASLFEAVTLSYIYQPGTSATINPVNPATSYFKGLQAGIFLNLGVLMERPYLVKQSKEELNIANNDQDEYMLTFATEIKKRFYLYVQRLAELKLAAKAVQDEESSLNSIKYKFEKGEETFDNYNKIQNDYTNRQLFKVQAESNLFMAKADLEELLGTQLENIK